MDKLIVSTDKAPKVIGPYAQGVRVGNLLFTSGQIPIEPETGNLLEGDIRLQTRRVIENLRAVLEAEGASLKDVIKATVYLTNIDDFSAMNEVYSSYFERSPHARSTVGVSRLPRGAKLEIDFVAKVE